MTLPAASAAISMSMINTEFGRTSNTSDTTLASASIGSYGTINTANASGDRPDGSTPHSMSEFYSYDHDLVTNATFNSWTGSFSGNDITFSVTVGGSNQTKTGYGIFVTGSSGALRVGKQQVSGDTMDTTIQIAISTAGSPGTSGTDNSAGGFVNIANSSGSFNDGISDLSGNTQLYFKFKAIPFLFLFIIRYAADTPLTSGGRKFLVSSPPGVFSILITSAPRSANSNPQVGPAII